MCMFCESVSEFPLYGREGPLYETASWACKVRSASQPLVGADALQCIPNREQGYFRPVLFYVGFAIFYLWCCSLSSSL